MARGNGSKRLAALRWTARVLAGVAAGIIVLFFVGEGLAEGFEPLLRMSLRETLMTVAFGAVFLGLLLGWIRELYGGLLTLAGLAAFYAFDLAFSGTFPRGPYFLLLASPSLLFLACGLLTRDGSDVNQD